MKLWNWLSHWVGVAVLAVILIVLALGLNKTSDSQDSQQLVLIHDAVLSAAMQCYALEGAYPNQLEYLRRHYGLMIDEEKYLVIYETAAANMPPTIAVAPRYLGRDGQ